LIDQASNVRFWQALTAADLSANKSRALARELGSFSDGDERLRKHPALTPNERQRIAALDHAVLERAVAMGIEWCHEDRFPALLHQTALTPCGLFAWGDFDCLHEPTIAIVGTRGASTYGKAVAHKFGEAFARAGVTVISGGALGIDGAAHKGALSVDGRTAAVLAGGVDRLYPAIHRGLFGQIRQRGCLVSQFPVGSQPSAYRFLTRNGLIAALSLGVVVIEAPLKSGAMSTAHRANELGRQVFVVPANIDNFSFAGSHSLIRDGATLVDHPDQVLEELGIEPVAAVNVHQPASTTGGKILEVLTVVPLAVEFIVERTGLDPADVMSELTMLEIEGRIIRDAGGFAIRP
jgi:DNA processing protein